MSGLLRTIRAYPRVFYTTVTVVGGVAFAVVLWDMALGGFYFRVLGVRVSSWEVYKPFRIGMLAIVAAMAAHDWMAEPVRTSWNAIDRWSGWIAGAIAIASVAVAIHWGIGAAGGADAYGYVSQAALWAEGHLSARDPLAAIAALVGPAAAPLGYQMAATPGAIVPTYPAGLPILMAIAIRIGGPSAAYLVVPLSAGLVVWLTYLLASRIAGGRAGLIAAILVAFSPIFLFQSLEPMSDVPATAWWLLAWVLALSPGSAAAFGAGLSVSAALLTRPNLAPLAIVLVAAVALVEPRRRRVALLAAGIIPGCAAVAALNTYWYGSPLRSGYGPLDAFYAWDHVVPNLHRQWTWMIELDASVILLAAAAPWTVRARTTAAAMLAFFAVLIGCYACFLVFDDWPFFRFLLPGLPLMIALAAAVIVRALSWLPLPVRGVALCLLCTLAPIAGVLTADRHTVFDIQRSEHRYVAVGGSVGVTLPDNAVVLTVIQSGSVRMYGQRPTLRWDKLDPRRLDAALDGLQAAGYAPYLLLESWEDDLFRARFAATRAVVDADRRPAIEYYGPISVRVVRLGDADAYCGDRHLLPHAVPGP
jgi:hypothetical protein